MSNVNVYGLLNLNDVEPPPIKPTQQEPVEVKQVGPKIGVPLHGVSAVAGIMGTKPEAVYEKEAGTRSNILDLEKLQIDLQNCKPREFSVPSFLYGLGTGVVLGVALLLIVKMAVSAHRDRQPQRQPHPRQAQVTKY